MAYVGREPWHGLGVKIEGDAMTAAEALDAAAMDWEVEIRPLYVPNGSGMVEVESNKASYRKDTETVLGIVGNRYTPLQNRDAFGFFDSVVGDGDAIYHTVGSLWGGRQMWILAKLLGDDYVLDNGDKLDSFILLDNSHDGTSALRMRTTEVRVVCSNTLGMATGQKPAFYARHTSGVGDKVAQARDLLGLNAAHMERFMKECNKVASKAFDDADMEALTRHLLYLNPEKALDEQYGVKAEAADTMTMLFNSGEGNKGETRWDAYNAVTEYTDYYRGYGNSVESIGSADETVVEQRLYNSWFGEGEALRMKAWKLLQLPKAKLAKALEPEVVNA